MAPGNSIGTRIKTLSFNQSYSGQFAFLENLLQNKIFGEFFILGAKKLDFEKNSW